MRKTFFPVFFLPCLFFFLPSFSLFSQGPFYKDALLFSVDSKLYFESDYKALADSVQMYDCMNRKSALLQDLDLLKKDSYLPSIRLLKIYYVAASSLQRRTEEMKLFFEKNTDYIKCQEQLKFSTKKKEDFEKYSLFYLDMLISVEKYWQDRFSFKEAKNDIFLDFIDVQIPYEFF